MKMMFVFTIMSALLYLIVWCIPKVGKQFVVFLVIVQIGFYWYTRYPTTAYYVKLIERNAGIQLTGNIDIKWGWVSEPFAFPLIFDDRAADILLSIEGVITGRELLKNDCVITSSKVQKIYGANGMKYCWKGSSVNGREDIYFCNFR